MSNIPKVNLRNSLTECVQSVRKEIMGNTKITALRTALPLLHPARLSRIEVYWGLLG